VTKNGVLRVSLRAAQPAAARRARGRVAGGAADGPTSGSGPPKVKQRQGTASAASQVKAHGDASGSGSEE
jgi:hypothetical protein